MINRYQWKKQDSYLLLQVASLKSITKFFKGDNLNNGHFFKFVASIIDPVLISNDWTSLSVICFGIKNAQKIRKCVEHGETLHDITLSKEKLIDVPLKKFNEITSKPIFQKWEFKGYIPDFNLLSFNIEGTKKASIFHK